MTGCLPSDSAFDHFNSLCLKCDVSGVHLGNFWTSVVFWGLSPESGPGYGTDLELNIAFCTCSMKHNLPRVVVCPCYFGCIKTKGLKKCSCTDWGPLHVTNSNTWGWLPRYVPGLLRDPIACRVGVLTASQHQKVLPQKPAELTHAERYERNLLRPYCVHCIIHSIIRCHAAEYCPWWVKA